MTDERDGEFEARRARRAWIAANHPDRGGDPAAFDEGLRRLGPPAEPTVAPKFAVRRSRSPLRRLRRLAKQVQRRRRGDPPRRLR